MEKCHIFKWESKMKWREVLKEQQNKSVIEQQENKVQIIEAFREMWKENTTEQQFAEYTSGLVLFPECIFIMVKE